MPYPAKTSPEAILAGAIEHLERDGLETLSMRGLADALGVKAPSLYRHYPDRAAIEFAMAAEGARLLHERLEAAASGRAGLTAARAAGHAYLKFARARPALYDLIGSRPAPPGQPDPGKPLWNLVLALVGAVSGREDDTAGAVALWSYLHGFVSLERAGLFGASGSLGGFEVGLEALLEGLRARGEPGSA